MKRLFVYLPCYNEAENIGSLVDQWLAEKEALASEGYSLTVTPVDDASTDGTLAVIREKAEANAEVRCLAHPENKNLGGVLTTAIRDFLGQAESDDLFCFMDGDNTHKPRDVHALLRVLPEGRGCAIASRYRPGAEIRGLSALRKAYSVFARIYYTMMLRVPAVRDYTCGYRVYTRAALSAGMEKYGDKLIENKSFACMMELLYKLHRSGCRFREAPFSLCYGDKQGASKMRVLKTMRDSLLTAWRLRRSA